MTWQWFVCSAAAGMVSSAIGHWLVRRWLRPARPRYICAFCLQEFATTDEASEHMIEAMRPYLRLAPAPKRTTPS